jgi:AmmeMemoRadiSam system protein A
MLFLSDSEKKAVLKLAHQAVCEAVCKNRLLHPVPQEKVFEQKCGVFVTLYVNGRLRGCIGVVEAHEPLGECIVRCAAGAATEDPRFTRMSQDEAAAVEIEVSLLAPLERMQPASIEVGKHGLVVERGGRRGLLLPQVALEHHLERERFLEETCQKAGLPREAWKDAVTQIYGFTCEIVSERGKDKRRE